MFRPHLDSSTGILSGTPLTAGGSDSFRIICTDVNGQFTNDPAFSWGYRYLPEVTFGTPSGASFLNSNGLDLKLDYPMLDGNVKLYYTTDGTDPEDSSTKKEAAPGASVKIGANIGVGNSVTVRVLAYQSTAGNDFKWSNASRAFYYSVDRPVPPTANWKDGTTFTTALGVMLSCDTAGATIYYKLNGSTTYTIYTGKPIVLTKTTTLEVRSSLNNILSESVTYTYTKVAGVSVSGKVKSYNPNNATTIQLMQGGKEQYKTTIAADTGSGQKEQNFSFDAVAAGTYDLVVTKPGHLTYTITGVKVESGNVDLTADASKAYSTITLLAGDVDQDGNINESDVSVIRYASNINKPVSSAANPLADVDGDGNVNESDVSIVRYAVHINKNTGHCTFVYAG